MTPISQTEALGATMGVRLGSDGAFARGGDHFFFFGSEAREVTQLILPAK